MSERRPASRRGMVGALVVLLWLGGLGLLVRREYFRPDTERLAEAAMRVTPGAVYYGVMQGDRQIGFASSTVDTAATTISVDDYLVADLPVGGRVHRASAQTHVVLSRALRMKSFDVTFTGDADPIIARGHVESDSVLRLLLSTGNDTPVDTQVIKIAGPILLPTLVPLAVALTGTPKVGRQLRLPVFDPVGLAPREVTVGIRAESSFVLADSAGFDPEMGKWRGMEPVVVRAFEVRADTGVGAAGFSGWVDEQGRVVRTSQLGFELRRLPYEVAFENWRLTSDSRAAQAARVSEDRDILETTAIGANRRLSSSVVSLAVRFSHAELAGFDLTSPRQEMHGDTLFVRREAASQLAATYALPDGGRRLMPELTMAEPLVQSTHPEIVKLANQIAGRQRAPRIVAERINRWVYDSLQKRITFGIPSALQVLRSRSGDCNEHAQLYVALARAAGIPARIAAGLAYIDGKFYYHAWPEVYLREWVAVDPTFGQFPADAAHLRFVVGGLGRQAELLRLMGRLKVEVLKARGEGPGARD